MLSKEVINEINFNICLAKTVKFFLKKLLLVQLTELTLKQYYDDVNTLMKMDSIEQLLEYKDKNKMKIYSESIIQ
jgi:hypothetical protein